jgi:hypothetical protein
MKREKTHSSVVKSGFAQVHRDLLLEVFKLIDKYAKRKEQRINARLVIQAIWINVGYEQAMWFKPYEWETTIETIVHITGLEREQVKRSLEFLKTLPDPNRLGKNSLMLLEIQILTENQYNEPTGLEPNRLGKTRRTDWGGIRIKALFLQRYKQGAKTEPTGYSEPNRTLITKKLKTNLEEKVYTSLTADPELCTLEPPPEPESFVVWDMDDTTTAPEPEPEPTAEPLPTGYKTGLGALNVKVKNGLVQEDTHRSLASSPEPQNNNAIEQAPVHVSEPIAETKRTADTKATGQAHLTAQRGGITLEQAKEQYPQLERGVKYLTYLNKLGVVFYPTHLDAFNKAIQTHDNKPEPNAHDKPIAQALRRFGRERAKCDTVEQALEQAKQQQVLEYFGREPEQRQEYAWGGR